MATKHNQRWYCRDCREESRVRGLYSCKRIGHSVVRLCGYSQCFREVRSNLNSCDNKHDVLARRESAGKDLHPEITTTSGEWLFRERIRLGLTRTQVCEPLENGWYPLHCTSLLFIEVDDLPLPPDWLEPLISMGFRPPMFAESHGLGTAQCIPPHDSKEAGSAQPPDLAEGTHGAWPASCGDRADNRHGAVSEATPTGEQVVIWNEVSVAELEAVERVTIEVTPAGDWNCGSLFDEFEGSAGSLDAGKLASAGALANLLEWFREWGARLESGHDLLIIEVPEDDGFTYCWHFDRYTRHHKFGEEPTLEAAQTAAIQAASRHDSKPNDLVSERVTEHSQAEVGQGLRGQRSATFSAWIGRHDLS